ncbi:MAG: AAA family ATPase [Thermoguttaceae bacterium]|jgi:wobble nucleotide-excising tRNase
MIESIHIADFATYGSTPEVLSDLSKFNFLFGSNASGKTTITRVIADDGIRPTCRVTWKGGTKLQAMVYNLDFVDKNFNQSAELKGIFTLGEKNVDILKAISAAKADLDLLTNNIEMLTKTLQGENGAGGKKGELVTLEEEFKDKCWAQKQKHDAKLFGAFTGFRNNAENFKEKVLQEWASNSETLASLAELEKKAETVFGPTPTFKTPIPDIDTVDMLAHESNPILQKRIIGKKDVNIAAMIQKLGNSDWVRTCLERSCGARKKRVNIRADGS